MREQRTTEKGVFKEEKNVTLKGAYTEGRKLLEQAGIPEPDLDAWYLLEYVTGVRRASYYADPDREMTGAQEKPARPSSAYYRGTGIHGIEFPCK